MKRSIGILACAVALAACNPGGDHKPAMQQEHDTLEKAKQVDSLVQQQTQQQKQEVDSQAQ